MVVGDQIEEPAVAIARQLGATINFAARLHGDHAVAARHHGAVAIHRVLTVHARNPGGTLIRVEPAQRKIKKYSANGHAEPKLPPLEHRLTSV